MSKSSFDVFWKWTIIVFLAGTLYAKVFVLAEDYALHKIAEDVRASKVEEMNIRIGQMVEKIAANQASLEKIEHKLGIYEPTSK